MLDITGSIIILCGYLDSYTPFKTCTTHINHQVIMGPTRIVIALFCVTILLITSVTAGPLIQSEQRKLIDAINYQLQDHGRKS
jgi:hypothetical protein